jgi:peptidoglycan/LPS O-acetylase OafA/YrhL
VEEIEPNYTIEIVVIIVLVVVSSTLLAQVLTKFVEAPAQRRIRQRLGDFHWRQRA